MLRAKVGNNFSALPVSSFRFALKCRQHFEEHKHTLEARGICDLVHFWKAAVLCNCCHNDTHLYVCVCVCVVLSLKPLPLLLLQRIRFISHLCALHMLFCAFFLHICHNMLSIQRRMLFVAYTHEHTRIQSRPLLMLMLRASTCCTHTARDTNGNRCRSRLCGIKNLVKITKR